MQNDAFKKFLLFFSFWMVFVAKTASSMKGPYPDLWGHLLCGLDHLSRGALSRADIYSYTAAGTPFIDHAWLSELFFARLWTAFGMTGLWGLRLIVVAVIFGLVLRRIAAATESFRAGLLIFLLCGMALGKYLVFRPLLFTALFFTIFLYIALKIFVDKKWPLATAFFFVPLMLLWTNVHGGFLIGLCLTAWLTFCAGVEALQKKAGPGKPVFFLSVFILCCAATLINPYGPELWRWLFAALTYPRSALITEWSPAYRYHPPWAVLTFYLLNGLAVVSFFKTRLKKNLFEWGLLAAVSLAAWMNIRHEMIFSVTAAMVLPRHLENVFPRLKSPDALSRRFVYFFFVACFSLSVFVHVLPGRRPGALLTENHPANAFRFIRGNRLKGNLLAAFDWAQSSLWYLHGSCKIAFDGRFRTAYPLSVEKDYFHFHAFSDKWSVLLDRYDTQMVLVPENWASADALKQREDWVLVYRAPVSFSSVGSRLSALFIRKNAFPDFEKTMKEGTVYYPPEKSGLVFGEKL
jgi:hypothetical protein